MPQPKTILISGATGQQSTSLIAALPASEFHILALTRSKSSPAAQRLSVQQNVTLVEGDLNDSQSITRIFENAKDSHGGVWGVFMVLAYPGMGQSAEGEEKQGKTLVDIAREYGASAFVYSSALRSGPKYDDEQELSGKAKVTVERYVKRSGMPWVIVKPGFFMENFSGYLGPLAVSLMQQGLKSDTKLDLISAKDIGSIVSSLYQNFHSHTNTTLALISESLPASQISQTYWSASSLTTRVPATCLSQSLARIVLLLNSDVRKLTETINLTHERVDSGEYPEREGEIQAAKEVYDARTSFAEWVRESQDTQGPGEGWNRVSLWGLLRGM